MKKGETLALVAKKLRVTRSDLAEANYLSVRARLSTGQQLIIPKPPALLDAPDAVLAAVTGEETPDVVKPAAAAPTARTRLFPSAVCTASSSGDTLFSIARLYRTTVTSIREWNNLRGTTIRIGQRLTIRGSGSQAD